MKWSLSVTTYLVHQLSFLCQCDENVVEVDYILESHTVIGQTWLGGRGRGRGRELSLPKPSVTVKHKEVKWNEPVLIYDRRGRAFVQQQNPADREVTFMSSKMKWSVTAI
jgi:hypothetical protein